MMRWFAMFLVLLALGGPARGDALIALEQPDLYDLEVVGFELPRQVEIEIDAVGRFGRDDDSWLERFWTGGERPLDVYAWLIESPTRKPIWVMSSAESTRESETLRRVTKMLRLGPGRYELYLFSGYRHVARLADKREREGRPLRWWETLWSGRGESPEALRGDLKHCHVTLSVPGLSEDEVRRFDVTGDRPEALIRLNRAGDSTFERRTFELDRPMSLRVYTLFEQVPGSSSPADYGWIVDARTREVVWQPDRGHARPAGGGEKNQLIDAEQRLPAGRYQVHYGSDDSHSFSEFNTYPPYDPLNWGLTLLPGEGFDAAAFRVVPEVPVPPLIDLSGAGDSQSREQAFRLNRANKLQVHALAECVSDDGPCADRAWIADAATGRTVWEIAKANTQAAGGGRKNRLFDGLVELAAGDYVLGHETDDSHSFPRWNVAPPFEPAAWGVRIWAGPGMEARDFRILDQAVSVPVRTPGTPR